MPGWGMDVQGDKTIEPTTANYTFKHVMEEQNTTYEIDLGPSQLREVNFPPLCPKHQECCCLSVTLQWKLCMHVLSPRPLYLASICH